MDLRNGHVDFEQWLGHVEDARMPCPLCLVSYYKGDSNEAEKAT